MRVKAMVKNLGVSPKKLGLIVDIVRGKGVAEAMDILRFLPSPAGKSVAKVVKSASANAENNFQMDPAKLKIAEIFANEGRKVKRGRAKARGRTGPIIKRSSHVVVIVEEQEGLIGK